ncbi:MAG: hypothetical protein LBK99_13820 [Opitutaceae bacterium]|nr:hypothetical protein [Opitutaceae bacterium]
MPRLFQPEKCMWFRGLLRSTGLIAAALALSVSLALWLGGALLARRSPLTLDRAPNGTVLLARRDAPPSPSPDAPAVAGHPAFIEVWPDADVLGENYGQELRRWILAAGGPTRLAVRSRWRERPARSGSGTGFQPVDDAQRRPLSPGKIICLRELQLFTVNDTKVSREAALYCRSVHGLEARATSIRVTSVIKWNPLFLEIFYDVFLLS